MGLKRINHFGIFQKAGELSKIPQPVVCCQSIHTITEHRTANMVMYIPINPLLLNGFKIEDIDSIVSFINDTKLCKVSIIAKNEETLINVKGNSYKINVASILLEPDTSFTYSNYFALLLLRPLYSSINKHYAKNIVKFYGYEEFRNMSTVKKLLLIAFTMDNRMHSSSWGFFADLLTGMKSDSVMIKVRSDEIDKATTMGMWKVFGVGKESTYIPTGKINKLFENKEYEEVIKVFNELW
jgi:hypothetical protein